MKAEKIHKHLEENLAHLQQRTLSSSADSPAYAMYLMDPPTQDGQVVQGPGWAPWVTLTQTGRLEFPPQSVISLSLRSQDITPSQSLMTFYTEGGTSAAVEICSRSCSSPSPKQQAPASLPRRENLLTGMLLFNCICQSYFYFLELSKI